MRISEIGEYNTHYLIERLGVLESRLQGASSSTKRSIVAKCAAIAQELTNRFNRERG